MTQKTPPASQAAWKKGTAYAHAPVGGVLQIDSSVLYDPGIHPSEQLFVHSNAHTSHIQPFTHLSTHTAKRTIFSRRWIPASDPVRIVILGSKR